MPVVGEEEVSRISTTIFSNPCSDRLTLRYSYQEPTDLVITGYDIQGRRVFDHSRRGLSGSGSFSVVLTGIPEGVYLLKIQEGEAQRIEKLIYLR
ncbi:MAG TPA: T9SS type A sorting domain-containing protein [bacterium (Candidatus Stahlbacteria)]|nr:T9SS type A sorting domain-containing protein [Candidatus Stahlbacteria bacterium]